MRIIKFIIFLFASIPFFVQSSGCFDDSFLDSIKEEEDFVSAFDVALSDNSETFRTVYFRLPPLDTSGNYTVNSVTEPGTAKDGEDNVVVDNTTGLMWTRCSAYIKSDPDGASDSGDEVYDIDRTGGCTESPAKISWIKAADFCKVTMNSGSGYAGYTDWTVPKISELVSIINFYTPDPDDPQIDITAFPNTINTTNSGYWSFTSRLFIGTYYETIDYGWIVFFTQSGTGFQLPSFTNSADFRAKFKADYSDYESQYIRCVRGGVEEPF